MNVNWKRRAILKSTQCKKNMNMATFAKLSGNELKYSIMNTCTFCKSDFLTRSEWNIDLFNDLIFIFMSPRE